MTVVLDGVAVERQRRIRRSAWWGGFAGLVSVAALGVSFVLRGAELGIAAWFTAPLPVVVGALAAWGGARQGRREGTRDEVRNEALTRDEIVLSVCPVRVVPADPDGPAFSGVDHCDLMVSNLRLFLWQDSTLLWCGWWREVSLTAEGDEEVILHDGGNEPVAWLQVEKPTLPEELVLAAARLKRGPPAEARTPSRGVARTRVEIDRAIRTSERPGDPGLRNERARDLPRQGRAVSRDV
ncbi:hypothetical protein [Streptomyces sp. cmx-4-9]|uniref:hypothetical protein n=1 Tax=Streptomyces sp. cmx-4-9 TaxID=2790941 RepID=UPI0039813A1D